MPRPQHVHEPLTEGLEDPDFFAGRPHEHYARLRHASPVAWNEPGGWWAVSTHAEVMQISRDPETFCSRRGILTFEIGAEYDSPPTMMHTDPPEHTRYRKLVAPGFAPSVIRSLEPEVRRQARALLDRISPGEPLDFTATVAVEYPLILIALLLGIPSADWPRFFDWSEAAIPGARPEWSDAHRQHLMQEMQEALMTATKQRRRDPRDDIISIIASVELDGNQLSDAELIMFLNQLLVAGNETTRNMISGGMWALAQHPDQWQRLVADRSLVATTVEEWLRWTTPVPAFMRTATRDTELRGVPIGAGDPVVMLYAAANRDEETFGPTADRFDVGRDPNPHVAFGFGAHFCIGAALARLEGRVLLEELLDRFRDIEPAGPVEWAPGSVIAGIRRTPLVLR